MTNLYAYKIHAVLLYRNERTIFDITINRYDVKPQGKINA